ncbi:hypothetical protein Pelo_6589 [Pelomyxa schiedti]|nr:hypothetical protein Pelo_6589 [Pelomyxa schiedti]
MSSKAGRKTPQKTPLKRRAQTTPLSIMAAPPVELGAVEEEIAIIEREILRLSELQKMSESGQSSQWAIEDPSSFACLGCLCDGSPDSATPHDPYPTKRQRHKFLESFLCEVLSEASSLDNEKNDT